MRSMSWRAGLVMAALLAVAPARGAAMQHGGAPHGGMAADSTLLGDPGRFVPRAAGAADDGPPAPPVDTLVTRALERAPSLAALRARVQEARELVRPAGALPDPMLDLMVQDIGFPTWTFGREDMSMIGPQLTQGIPFPGKQGARRRVARAQADVKVNELEQLRREVARDVRSLCARLYALDKDRDALASGHEVLGVLAATVRDRYSAGVAEAEAAIKAQLVLTRVSERLDDLAADRLQMVAALNRLLDQPGEAALGRVAALPEPAVPPLPWDTLVVARSVDVAVRRAEVRVAERKLEAARMERWPDLVAGAGVGFRGSKDPAVSLRLGLELPLWSGQKQGPMIRAAGQELEASRQSLREAEAGARAEAARLEAQWRRASVQVTRYEQTIVPQSGMAFDAARASYLVGRGDFSTLVEDLNLWLEARTGLAQHQADRYVAWAELQNVIDAGGPADERREGR